MDRKGLGTGKPRGPRGPNRTDEQTATVLSALADPFFAGSVKEIAQEAGVSEAAARALVDRLRTRGVPLYRALGQVEKKETEELFALRAHQMLLSITPRDLEKATLYQKVVGAAIATDKALLLSGQPTAIHSVKELAAVDALGQLILQEMGRRGFDLRTDPETQAVSVEPRRYMGRSDPGRVEFPDSRDEPA